MYSIKKLIDFARLVGKHQKWRPSFVRLEGCKLFQFYEKSAVIADGVL